MFDEQTVLMVVLLLVAYCLFIKPNNDKKKTTSEPEKNSSLEEEGVNATPDAKEKEPKEAFQNYNESDQYEHFSNTPNVPQMKPMKPMKPMKHIQEMQPIHNLREKFANVYRDSANVSSSPNAQFTEDLEDYKKTETVQDKLNRYTAKSKDKVDAYTGSLLGPGADPTKIPDKRRPVQGASELLPRNKNDWVKQEAMVPMLDQDLLDVPVRELFNIDTVSGSLRNPSLDVRGDLEVTRIKDLSPWMNSSIVPDKNLVALCETRENLFKDQHSRYIKEKSPMYTGNDYVNQPQVNQA